MVTGATSGSEQAIAAHLATEGANLALNYRNDPEKLDETKELIAQMCDQVIQVNLRGAYLCAREVIKHLLDRNHCFFSF